MALGVILMSPVSAFAYKLLEPLPGLADSDNVTLSSYLSWLFPFALTVTAVLAVIMIVIGGLQLAGGGSESLKTSGKKRIESAIYGLLLAVSAYLILNTINPNLVNMSLSIDPIKMKEENRDNQAGSTVGPTYFALNWQNTKVRSCTDQDPRYVEVDASFCSGISEPVPQDGNYAPYAFSIACCGIPVKK